MEVVLSTNRDTYYPGDLITGALQVRLTQPLTIQKAVVTFSQVEQTRVRVVGLFPQSSRHLHFLATDILARDGAVSLAPTSWKPGFTRFEFQFSIPRTASPTVNIDDENHCLASIEAQVEITGTPLQRWTKEIAILPTQLILAPFVDSLISRSIRAYLNPVHSCFDKSDAILAVWRVENLARAPVRDVTLELQQKVVLRSKGTTTKSTKKTVLSISLIREPITRGLSQHGTARLEIRDLELPYSLSSMSPIAHQKKSASILLRYISIDYILVLIIQTKAVRICHKVPVLIGPMHYETKSSVEGLPAYVRSRVQEDQARCELLERILVERDQEIELLQERTKEDGNARPVCCICLEKLASIVFVPCGHLCTCESCDKSLRNRECPLCRKAIEQAFPIFT